MRTYKPSPRACPATHHRTNSLQTLLRTGIRPSTYLAFSSTLCCLGVSQGYAVGVTDDNDAVQLTIPTLGVDTGYSLQQSSSAQDEWLTITKYLIDATTGELTAMNYDVTTKPLGDSDGDTTLYFQWEEVTTDGSTYMTLKETSSLEPGGVSIKVHSSLNLRVTEDDTTISNSFAGISGVAIPGDTEHGGAVNQTVSDTIEGDFVGNSILLGAGTNSSGGALGAKVTANTVIGNFIGNSATDQGGAIYHHISLGEKKSIRGNFIGNSSVLGAGGAIAGNQGYISDITGDFIANSAGTSGGALYFSKTHISTVSADFFDNIATTHGGAINLQSAGRIDTLKGDFTGNRATTNGGAISLNNSSLGSLTGDFIANSAQGLGGAIFNNSSNIGLLAVEQSIYFTGNTAKGNSNAIYTFGISNSEMHLNTYSGHRIVVNDGIDGYAEGVDRQILNINNGMNGLVIYEEHKGKDFSTVEFNNAVKNHTINVNGGTLELGEFGGALGGTTQAVASSQAQLTNNKLTVFDGARVEAYSGAALGDSASANSITNSGTISYDQGTLVNDMTLRDGGALDLRGSAGSSSKISATGGANEITGTGRSNNVSGTINVYSGASLDINQVALSADTIVINAAARTDVVLTDGIVTGIKLGERNSVSGVASSSLAAYAGNTSSVDLHVYDMLNVGAELNALSLEGSITFDIPMSQADFDSHFATSSVDQMLIFQFGEGVDAFGSDYSRALDSGLEIYLNIEGKLYKADYEYVNADGSLALGFSSRSEIIPEPSTATLSMLALAGLLARRHRRAR